MWSRRAKLLSEIRQICCARLPVSTRRLRRRRPSFVGNYRQLVRYKRDSRSVRYDKLVVAHIVESSPLS